MKQRFGVFKYTRNGYWLPAMLCAFAATWSLGAAAAEVYTWTDESGVVHYSDSPRDSGASEAIQVEEIYRPGSVGASAKPDQPQQAPMAQPGQPENAVPVSAAQARREQMAADRAKREEAQAETERLCNQHRQRLEQMEPSRRVFYTDDQGETVRMDDEQRVQMVEESKAYLARNCGG